MFDAVIVGYDGTPPSRRAVEWAAAEAVERGARLEVVSCYEVPWVGRSPVTVEHIDEICAETDTRLNEVVAAVARAHPALAVEGDTRSGKPRQVLLDSSDHADLVVVGGGHLEPRGGATARFVPRHAHTPVAIVPRDAAAHGIERIIVGVDGDSADGPALDWAADEAARRDVPLQIVHADPHCGGDARQVIEHASAAARRGRRLDLVTVIAPTDPAPALLDGAHDGDLVVVGRRHSSAAGSMLFGTCLRALLRRSKVPMVVVYGRR